MMSYTYNIQELHQFIVNTGAQNESVGDKTKFFTDTMSLESSCKIRNITQNIKESIKVLLLLGLLGACYLYFILFSEFFFFLINF